MKPYCHQFSVKWLWWCPVVLAYMEIDASVPSAADFVVLYCGGSRRAVCYHHLSLTASQIAYAILSSLELDIPALRDSGGDTLPFPLPLGWLLTRLVSRPKTGLTPVLSLQLQGCSNSFWLRALHKVCE